MPYWEVDIWNLRSFQWLVWCNFFIFFHPIFEGLAKQQNYERWWLRCQIYSFYQFQSNVLLMLRPGKKIIIFIGCTCCYDKSNIHLESNNILPTRQSASKQYSYFIKPDQWFYQKYYDIFLMENIKFKDSTLVIFYWEIFAQNHEWENIDR